MVRLDGTTNVYVYDPMFETRKASADFISLGTFFFALALPGLIPRRGCLRPRQGLGLGVVSPVFIGVLPGVRSSQTASHLPALLPYWRSFFCVLLDYANNFEALF